jgi:hypothetical protein
MSDHYDTGNHKPLYDNDYDYSADHRAGDLDDRSWDDDDGWGDDDATAALYCLVGATVILTVFVAALVIYH